MPSPGLNRVKGGYIVLAENLGGPRTLRPKVARSRAPSLDVLAASLITQYFDINLIYNEPLTLKVCFGSLFIQRG